MKIATKRPIAIFDLDGVLVQNPPEALTSTHTLQDPDYWHKHWSNPRAASPNREMFQLANVLKHADFGVVILTARPDSYRMETLDFLWRWGMMADVYEEYTDIERRAALVMRPAQDGITSSGQWKLDTIHEWQAQGAKIQFMIEDYKPNADVVRQAVPVLLYERKKTPEQKAAEIAYVEAWRGQRDSGDPQC